MTSRDDYSQVHQGAAIGAISSRAQIAVAGPDRAAYLQGLLSNDIEGLSAGTGCYAAWLTPQGRMITDLHVLQSDDMVLLDVPAGLAEALLARLDQFLFAENVQLGSLQGALTGVWVHGPAAAAALERVVEGAPDLGEWGAYTHGRFTFAGSPLVVARIDQLGVPGFCLYIEPSREKDLVEALEGSGARRVAPDAIEAARIEVGYPVFGTDMTEDTIPLEAGIESRAISFTKGCYVGQEVIIRVLHRGGGRVAKKLVALRVDGAAPAIGARVMADGKDVGVVTSAAVSPVRGSIALAYVRRDYTSPDSAVEITADAGAQAAVVTTRPMPTAA